ncbi:MAG: YdcH family protein [Cypionkella sp.]|nr:YdcH family protein [Cypionkella sp.]
MNATNEMSHTEVLANRLAMLRSEHRALDIQIDELAGASLLDRITIQRLKKAKAGAEGSDHRPYQRKL